MSLLKEISKKVFFVDGAMGTRLQSLGLKPGELPEIWNVTQGDKIARVHREYYEAGSQMVLTNTFGANALKLHGSPYTVEEIVEAAVQNALTARSSFQDGKVRFVALDIGPTGKLLKPLGELSFDDAYELFAQSVRVGGRSGVDAIWIETMTDTYELKAAVLAAKECSTLPVFATVSLDENGKLLTGGDISTVVALLEGLGVDALGLNCGLGPVEMLPLVEELYRVTRLPIIVKPNAGLPHVEGDCTCYNIDPEEYVESMADILQKGGAILGGCCGTDPDYLRMMVKRCGDIPVKKPGKGRGTLVSSYSRSVVLGEDPVIIGERINPTGKPTLKQALKDKNIAYVLKEGILQEEAGAHILDVNVGLPEINETETMVEVIQELQSILDLPLQIDTADVKTMEKALRYYNGKALINSVNGKASSMEEVFPLVAKYGGVVVGLTLDEAGIPDTAEGRLAIGKKIVDTAAAYGIDKRDIVIDVLCMTLSADENAAKTTLEALRLVKEELGVVTVLGVSNVSFGMPNRSGINASFYTMALQGGLDCAIINPKSREMLDAYYTFRAICGRDKKFADYLKIYGGDAATPPKTTTESSMSLYDSVRKGFVQSAGEATLRELETKQPLEVIDSVLIPALNEVGKGFENKTLFLPQLLMSAEACKASFEVLKKQMEDKGASKAARHKVILATVKGDIHDIGKNIVRVLIENYGFDVIDLGKDVAKEDILKTAIQEDVELVGLSALMTTTVVSMEETIKLLRKERPDCRIMVGGAVLNQEYANMVGADFYAKDAMGAVKFTQRFFEQTKVM